MEENTEIEEEVTILGQEPQTLLKYIYLALMALTAISVVFVFLPKQKAEELRYAEAAQRMEQIQIKMSQELRPSPELAKELEKVREELREGSFKNKGVALSLGLLTGLLGFGVFVLCLYLYFTQEEELGPHLRTHVKFLSILQVLFFVVGIILGIVFGAIMVLMFLISLVLIGAELYVLGCGYKMLKDEEDITIEGLKGRAIVLKGELEQTAKEKYKEQKEIMEITKAQVQAKVKEHQEKNQSNENENVTYLVLLRHGQSEWNLENRFTGFKDVELTGKGKREAADAGKRLADAGITFDHVFTSTLKRANHTAKIALEQAGQADLIDSMIYHDDLRERDYGDLTGLNKDETRAKYGDEQVHIWRRSYDVPPPGGECLKDVVENRVRPYYETYIKPILADGENVLMVAHGNSLRAMLIILGAETPETINQAEMETGVPVVFELEDGEIKKRYTLADKKAA